MTEKVIVSWSGGKDCAVALYELLRSGQYEVAALLTTVTEDYERISMHGVRRVLLRLQAELLGFALEEVFISRACAHEEYEANMRRVLTKYKRMGVDAVVFGDVFLEDLRQYRENNLAKLDLKGIFPLWKQNTCELARNFVALGFEAITTCVDTSVLDRQFVGRLVDSRFFAELPGNIDPCGENGEYHSFVYGGPIFREPLVFSVGEVVLRDNRFCYCDLVPEGNEPEKRKLDL
jgi:uncharacterized protein (TIGR00290 family)